MLKIQKYDMCDSVKASDHRPVSAAIDVFVENSKVLHGGDISLPSTTAKESEAPTLPESTRVVKIRIFNLDIRCLEAANSSSFGTVVPSCVPSTKIALGGRREDTSSSSSSIRDRASTCIIYFPLETEDPLLSVRQSILMNQALNLGSLPCSSLLTANNLRHIHCFELDRNPEKVLEFKTLVCSDTAR